MQKGKFIVIEGTDGSGKATQIELLSERLKKEGLEIETADFPQYDNFSSGFVAKYLRGEYGTLDEVGPYRGSIFFSVDRYDKSFDIKKWLDEGKTVFSNRYTSANMGHQTAKIEGKEKRDEFLDWLNHLEFDIFEIPKPDLTILLFVPPDIGQKLVDRKEAREYTKGKKRDIHEADINHLKKASEAFLYVAEKYGWTVIDCTENGQLLSREKIHEKIYEVVKKII
ncbi:MAG: deoxynucleoside kinase [Patescibacteria group bacterium]|nr:deoxynucleoside kinase [Patescibacteria group bacterium]